MEITYSSVLKQARKLTAAEREKLIASLRAFSKKTRGRKIPSDAAVEAELKRIIDSFERGEHPSMSESTALADKIRKSNDRDHSL